MSERYVDSTTPTLEVLVLRDGVIVHRELCETDDQAEAIVLAWSDTEGVVVEVDDLSRRAAPAGILEPRPWEVDPDDLVYEAAAYADDEDR